MFSKADDPASVMKLTVGAQEGIGNTFKEFTAPQGGAGTLVWNSHFDGEADQSAPLGVQPGDLFEDNLPVALRDLPLKSGFQRKARLWESLTTNHGAAPAVTAVTIHVTDEDTVHSHAGAIPCWKVAVDRDGGASDTYWFEKAEPHILVRSEAADGRKRMLYARARWSYWDKRLPRPNVLN